jgi:hypothetical protein
LRQVKAKMKLVISHLRWTAFFLLLTIFCNVAISQRIIVNSNGERIVMFPDGSWRLMEPGDSLLLNPSLQTSGTSNVLDDNADHANKGSIADQEEMVLRQWNEIHFNIRSLEKRIQNEFRAATNTHFSAAEIYHNAVANKNLIEPDRFETINENYEQSIQALRIAKSNQKDIKKLFEESKKLANLPPAKMEKKLNSLRSRFNLFVEHYKANSPGKSTDGIPSILSKPSSREREIPKRNAPVSSSTGKEKNIKSKESGSSIVAGLSKPYRSEPFKCIAKTDTVDAATGIRRIELEPGLLFTHTDPDLRPFFKNKELITCYGKLSKADAYVYLTIDFQIASSHSQSNFGALEKGSLLRLKLLNEEYVSLYNIRSDRGRIDAYSGYTIFTGQYALGKDEIKKLQDNELDKVRILWSTGYEDYDVYKVDFFIDRLNCLMNK